VSIASGVRIAAALRTRGHEVTSLDTALGVMDDAMERALLATGVQQAPPDLESLAAMSQRSLSPSLGTLPAVRQADVVFLALHGGQGEDGTLQALFDLCGVRYTGTGQLGSALAMDKDLSKRLFRDNGVGTAEWLMAPATAAEVRDRLGFPVVVKPSKQGSTVGLTLVRDAAGLEPAITEAFRYDDEVMLERFIGGRELTVGILGNEALPVGEIIPKHELYDYECKYTRGWPRGVPGPAGSGCGGDRAGPGCAGVRGAQAPGIRPHRLPPERFWWLFLSGGQHPSGHDGNEPDSAGGGCGRDLILGALRAYCPTRDNRGETVTRWVQHRFWRQPWRAFHLVSSVKASGPDDARSSSASLAQQRRRRCTPLMLWPAN
jgi:D-alanine-D-alanine ligase